MLTKLHQFMISSLLQILHRQTDKHRQKTNATS